MKTSERKPQNAAERPQVQIRVFIDGKLIGEETINGPLAAMRDEPRKGGRK